MAEIITEYRNENTKNIDLIPTIDMVKMMNEEDKIVARAVEYESENIAKAIDIVAKQFLLGGHLVYFGAGTSGRLGVLDASECPPTFSVEPNMVQGIIAGGYDALRVAVEGAEDDFDAGYQDAKILTESDVAVVISASGNPKYLLGVLACAEKIGCKTIGITCNAQAKIADEVGTLICVEVGPEVIAGSSRLKAGTAQKMVLNMISTGAMIKIGKTYENFMIDLNATNEKLKDRAIRIVSQIANVNNAVAFEKLTESGWKIKTAIVALTKNISINDANQELKSHCGVLRRVLKKEVKI